MDALPVVLVTIVGGLLVARAFRARWRARSAAPLDLSEWAPKLKTIPRSLKLFEFRNVIIPDERGTTEIDVILVGNTGVFVIEQKEYNAWIFGSEDDDKWTARYVDGSTHRLQNPLRQNYRHVMALVAQLGLPRDKFHSLVAFSGDCELKTPMPSNVLVGDYENPVRSTEGIRLTDTDVSRVCEALRALESRSTEAARDEHVGRLQERFSSMTTCPKCGAPLVQRRSTKPTSDGEPFLGCRAYPRCTYTRKINAT
jgi:restriction system protein